MNSRSSLWELVAKTSNLGFWCWDIQSNQIDWSDNIEHVLSCPSDSLADTFDTYRAMIDVADRNRVLQTIQKTIQSGIEHQIDYRIVLPDRTQRWIEGHGKVILSESGEAIQLLGTVRDITARLESENKVREREHLFQLVMDNIPAFIFWKDRDLVYQGSNQNFAEVAGFDSPKALVGTTDYDAAWKKEEADFFRDVDRRVMESDQAELNIIEPQLQASGKQAWLSTNKIPLHDETGQVIGILGMYTDITERIQAEEAQQQASKENALLAATVSNAPVGISISDPTQEDEPLVFVNPAFLAMTGYREEDFIGRNCRFLQGADTDPETVAQIHHALIKKEPITVEILNYRKDGSTFWNLLSITPLFDETGKHTHFIGMQTDITARKKSEELTRRALETAEAANQAKSDFIAKMSHELRTPLNGILGYAQILRREAHLTATQKQGLETIHQSGDYLLALVNNILNFSSLDAGQTELELSNVHLGHLLDNIVNTANMKAEQKHISFLYQKDDDLPSGIRGNKRYLEQLLSNLLDNTIKFTQKGQVIFKVTVVAADESTAITERMTLRFEVIDTGVGIRKKLLAKIFQPFEQLGTLIERADGTGLGLTITRQLVQLMGGEIKVESTIGEGSRFWCELTFELVALSDSELNKLKEIPNKRNQVVSPELSNAENIVAELLIPPQAALEALYEAAMLGMMSQIRKQMDDIEQLDAKYAPFALKIRKLAKGFEDEKIVALVEQYLAESQ